jgi:Peptidase dimerisation domain.
MLAIPGVTEKGMYNVKVEVKGPGGHSSLPPSHTVSSLRLV